MSCNGTIWVFRKPQSVLLIGVVLFLANPTGVFSQYRASEFELKAAFLVNFAKFVQWPDDAFENAASPIVITVLGDDPFGSYLDQAVRDRTVAGRGIELVRASRIDQLPRSNLVFVCSSEKHHYKEIVAALCQQPVVSVGEEPGFSDAGGMISFVLLRQKIGFVINLECARVGGPKLSAQLLKLAQSVRSV